MQRDASIKCIYLWNQSLTTLCWAGLEHRHSRSTSFPRRGNSPQISQILYKTTEPWRASHIKYQVYFPRGKLGKLHCVMDSNGTCKVGTRMAKGVINLIKAPFIPEGSNRKDRWNWHSQEKVARTETAVSSRQNPNKDLVWKEQGKEETSLGQIPLSLGMHMKPGVQWKSLGVTSLGLPQLNCWGLWFSSLCAAAHFRRWLWQGRACSLRFELLTLLLEKRLISPGEKLFLDAYI